MTRIIWSVAMGGGLLAVSALLYFLQILIFHRADDTKFYLLQDLAFLPVQVLLVTLLVDRLLARRERSTRYSFKTRLARLCRRAKTSRVITPYALRHTFASMESDAGTETTGLARLMGHSTTRTLERYVVNTQEHHRKAVTALQDRIRLVAPQPVDGDKTETKSNTESNTEISEAKRTCDAIVASPSLSTT